VKPWIVGHNDVLGPQELVRPRRQDRRGAGRVRRWPIRCAAGREVAAAVVEVPGVNEMDLLERVATHKAELAAVHDIHLDLGVNFYPELTPLLQLAGQARAGLGLRRRNADGYAPRPTPSSRQARADGAWRACTDRYFGHIKRINAGRHRPLHRRHAKPTACRNGVATSRRPRT
jgi:hypothetical protein